MKKYQLQDLASAGHTLFIVWCVVVGFISAIIVVYSDHKVVAAGLLAVSVIFMYVLVFCIARNVCVEGNSIYINTVMAPLKIVPGGENVIKAMPYFSPLYFEDDENGKMKHYYKVFFVKTNQVLRPWIIVSGYKDLEKVMEEAMGTD